MALVEWNDDVWLFAVVVVVLLVIAKTAIGDGRCPLERPSYFVGDVMITIGMRRSIDPHCSSLLFPSLSFSFSLFLPLPLPLFFSLSLTLIYSLAAVVVVQHFAVSWLVGSRCSMLYVESYSFALHTHLEACTLFQLTELSPCRRRHRSHHHSSTMISIGHLIEHRTLEILSKFLFKGLII